MTDKSEMSRQLFYPLKTTSFKDFTLIIPSVSVGNVGQLSTDLLIQSLQCEKAGFLWHPAILPVVGVDPYKVSSPELALSAEVFSSESHKLVLLQLRSSVIKKLRKAFLSDLVAWVKSSGIAQIAILTGSSNEERIDEQITSEPFRYLTNHETLLADTFRSFGWIALEQRFNFPALSKVESLAKGSDAVGQVVIPGGGFAKRLFELCSENGIPCTTLIKFCSEGDNIPDALLVVSKVDQWLKLIEKDSKGASKLVFPPSWSHLFGSPPPKQLY
ncbi:hypothetical protein ONE63_001140 [Megalurothrips usitatus]|uniref:Proteasome assembly chaperone 2 n=1 Tax=Megalurothrips usitatus TaxID=439358 RepID=A0AAV7XB62_9NEOP|nr:hypothetical protein ONE63_001140 [Megalurothrips usitatus]